MVKYDVVEPSSIKRFLLSLLSNEWSKTKGQDYGNIARAKWSVQIMSLDNISLDQEMTQHDVDCQESIRRRVESQKEEIMRGEPIMPLVIMYRTRVLVDGYARFFALQQLGIKATVYYGDF